MRSQVRIGKRKRLIYEIDGQRLVLDGTWTLSPNHDLLFTARAGGPPSAQTVYLKGAILKAQANALVVSVRQAQREDAEPAQRVTLFGRWSADARNRLVFSVEKAEGSEDRLTFQGGWEVGKHHELLYRYRQRSTSRRADDEIGRAHV